jgi:hypothetical protein
VISTIRFYNYRDNPLAPTFCASKIGGIFRHEHHLIQVTFIDTVPNASGEFEQVAAGHMVWKTNRDWQSAQETMGFAIDAFNRGTIGEEEGCRRH